MADDFAAVSADQEPLRGHYELLASIGQGTFGKVRLGRHIATQAEVAVKAIHPRGFSLRRPVQQEVDCMSLLHHPNIVELYEVMRTQDSFFLVMEYVSGGDLMGYLDTYDSMSEDEARGVFRQLVSAVHYCHQKGVVHRDLKPKNVLLGPRMRVKLIGFGLSAPFTAMRLITFCGSYYYAAPELFTGNPYDGPPVDIWSLGVMLYHVVTGTLPFTGEGVGQLRQCILRMDYTMPDYFTEDLQNLLRKFLTPKPLDTSSLEAIMPDPWLNRDEAKTLQPYTEPARASTDPWVTLQMVNKGYQVDEIESALQNKTYNNAMGTYLILKSQKLKVRFPTIQVKPFSPPEPTSSTPSRVQEAQPECSGPQQVQPPPQGQEAGPAAQESAAPAASPTTSTATPGTSPRLRMASTRPSPKWTKVMPRHSPKSRTPTPRPSPKSRTAPPKPSPKTANIPMHSPKRGLAAPPPSPESESRIAPRPPSPESESRSTPPPPSPESASRIAAPPPSPDSESRIAIPKPSPEWMNTTSALAPQCGNGGNGSNRSNSGSGSSGGTQEGTTQGRCGVVRRCLQCVRKLCLRLSKKARGKRNRVAPL